MSAVRRAIEIAVAAFRGKVDRAIELVRREFILSEGEKIAEGLGA